MTTLLTQIQAAQRHQTHCGRLRKLWYSIGNTTSARVTFPQRLQRFGRL